MQMKNNNNPMYFRSIRKVGVVYDSALQYIPIRFYMCL